MSRHTLFALALLIANPLLGCKSKLDAYLLNRPGEVPLVPVSHSTKSEPRPNEP
jgi:hypothetical protein